MSKRKLQCRSNKEIISLLEKYDQECQSMTLIFWCPISAPFDWKSFLQVKQA